MEQELVENIGRYHGQIRGVLEKLFGPCEHVLQRLVKQGRVEVIRNAIPGGLSYYQLSVSEARRTGAHEPRGAADKILRRQLAVLWFALMTDRKRKRLNAAECLRIAPGLNSPHVAEHDGEDSAVYRLYSPAPETKAERFAESLREDAYNVVEHEALSLWVARGTYRLAVVVESDERARRLERSVARRQMPPVKIKFETVPAFELIHQHVNSERNRGTA